jgi:hypothetical protein
MLAAIATFFNPLGWSSRRTNFAVFRDHLRRQGVPLYVAECRHPDREWDIADSDAEEVFRYEESDLVWQKERLFNLAVARLPKEITAVALLDADIVFQNDRWAEDSLALLRDGYRVLQPFDYAYRAPRGMLEDFPGLQPPRPEEVFSLDPIASNLLLQESIAHRWQRELAGDTCLQPLWQAHPGFAVVFDRKLVEEVGLYEKHTMGGGDGVVMRASLGFTDVWIYRVMGRCLAANVRQWAKHWHAQLREDRLLAATEGRVVHLWHGTMENRQYNTRYDPTRLPRAMPTWFESPEGKPLRWSPDAPEAARNYLSEYFHARQEDSE